MSVDLLRTKMLSRYQKILIYLHLREKERENPGISFSDLLNGLRSRGMRISKPTLHRALTEMEEIGFIEREVRREDREPEARGAKWVLHVSLAGTGRSLAEGLSKWFEEASTRGARAPDA